MKAAFFVTLSLLCGVLLTVATDPANRVNGNLVLRANLDLQDDVQDDVHSANRVGNKVAWHRHRPHWHHRHHPHIHHHHRPHLHHRHHPHVHFPHVHFKNLLKAAHGLANKLGNVWAKWRPERTPCHVGKPHCVCMQNSPKDGSPPQTFCCRGDLDTPTFVNRFAFWSIRSCARGIKDAFACVTNLKHYSKEVVAVLKCFSKKAGRKAGSGAEKQAMEAWNQVLDKMGWMLGDQELLQGIDRMFEDDDQPVDVQTRDFRRDAVIKAMQTLHLEKSSTTAISDSSLVDLLEEADDQVSDVEIETMWGGGAAC